MMKGYDALKLSRHARDNVSSLINYPLATPSVRLKLSNKNEKVDDDAASVTKHLITNTVF